MPKPKPWSEEERAQLQRMIEGGSTYRQVSQVLRRPTSCLIDACRRFGIFQPKAVTTEEQVLAICQAAIGMRPQDIAEHLGKSQCRINMLARELTDQGKLHRAGSPKFPRYFVNLEDAQRYEVAFQQDLAEREKERAKHKVALRNKARELARASKPAPEPKPKKEPKRAKVLVECARAATKTVAAPSPKPAKVIMPESVKVQVIPTPPSRFHFEPPPGWRGQITHDWMDRRLSKATNNARSRNE